MVKPVPALFESRVNVLASLAVVAALAAVGCGREPTTGRAPGRATLQIGPLFQTGGTSAIRDTVTRIRWIVSRVLPAPVTVIEDGAGPAPATHSGGEDSLTISFPLQGSSAEYEVVVKAIGAEGDTLFRIGPLRFKANQINERGNVALSVLESEITYIGPGAGAVKVVASQHTVNLTPGQTLQLTATAFGPSGTAIPRALFSWFKAPGNANTSVRDDGLLSAGNQRGSDKIIVLVATSLGGAGPRDTVVVNVSLGPAQVQLVSGGGQSATVGAQLANPIVVRVVAIDGVAVPGATVVFTPSSGSVTAATATSASDGTAQTRWTLGTATGTQTLNVSVQGVSGAQVAVTATATAAQASVAAITIVSILPTAITTAQSATIVAQAFTATGQPAAGVQVTFSSSGTNNTFTPATATTASNGQATTVFSSSTAETKTITATSGSVFASTALPVVSPNSGATTLVKVSGDNQVAHYGQNFPAAHVIQARNAQGQPVAGALVDWGTALGNQRKVTDANGMSTNQYFLPNDPVVFPQGVTHQIPVTLVGTSVVVIFFYTAAP